MKDYHLLVVFFCYVFETIWYNRKVIGKILMKGREYGMKKYIFVSFGFFLIFIGILLGLIFEVPYIKEFDEVIFSFVHSFRNEFFDHFFVIISYMGEAITIVGLCAFLLILPNRRRIGLRVSLVVLVSAIINYAIKTIVARPRPGLMYFISNPPLDYSYPTSYSFPSGHSQTAYLFYVVLVIFLICNYGRHKKMYPFYLTLGFIIPGCLPLSRIYLGVHYPSDVLAGISLGLMLIMLVMGYVNNIPYCRTLMVEIDRPKGTYDPDYQSIYYEENMGYVCDYYKERKKYMRCYVLGIDEAPKKIRCRVIAIIKRKNDIDNILVTVPCRVKMKKKEIKERVSFIEDYYEYSIIML